MVLITGGAHQGKLAYAKKKYPDVVWADGAVCAFDEIYHCEGIYQFHRYIERVLRQESEEFLIDLAGLLVEKNPGLIIVTDEIGYGIVPADPFERMYREATGRICTKLASSASEVYRILCGIGIKIK